MLRHALDRPWEFMVDVLGRSGGAVVRLTFTEKKFKVRGAPERENVVPVIVKRQADEGATAGRSSGVAQRPSVGDQPQEQELRTL
jgi:hypothetical protein